jgi:hypothetical protein
METHTTREAAKRIPFAGGPRAPTLLSVAWDTLLPMLGMQHVGALRLVNKECHTRVTQFPWNEPATESASVAEGHVLRGPWISGLMGSLRSWRACFPRAKSAYLRLKTLDDADCEHFRGLQHLETRHCDWRTATDVGFGQLAGTRLVLHKCKPPRLSGAGWQRLRETGLLGEPASARAERIAAALLWYRPAAEGGDANAQRFLGSCYGSGRGVPKDMNEAVRWYTRAAAGGNAVAQFRLAHLYLYGRHVARDRTAAFELLARAAKGGVAGAAYFLAVCFYRGWGVPRDHSLAFECAFDSVDMGSVRANSFVGACYERGIGVARCRDDAAIFFYTVGARHGDAYSIAALARLQAEDLARLHAEEN